MQLVAVVLKCILILFIFVHVYVHVIQTHLIFSHVREDVKALF